MEHIASQIHKALIKKNKTIAVAESCTGGLVSALLTSLSGSSKYFILGAVAYNNKVKTSILKIPDKIIAEKGAVSKEIAARMAQNVRKLAKTDFGIGITGIAGPTGGSIQKPIGIVFISLDSKNKKICRKFHFRGSRSSIRNTAALNCLKLLKTIL